jgi:hypothetical protein
MYLLNMDKTTRLLIGQHQSRDICNVAALTAHEVVDDWIYCTVEVA